MLLVKFKNQKSARHFLEEKEGKQTEMLLVSQLKLIVKDGKTRGQLLKLTSMELQWIFSKKGRKCPGHKLLILFTLLVTQTQHIRAHIGKHIYHLRCVTTFTCDNSLLGQSSFKLFYSLLLAFH